jgi:hypothetical protein
LLRPHMTSTIRRRAQPCKYVPAKPDTRSLHLRCTPPRTQGAPDCPGSGMHSRASPTPARLHNQIALVKPCPCSMIPPKDADRVTFTSQGFQLQRVLMISLTYLLALIASLRRLPCATELIKFLFDVIQMLQLLSSKQNLH